MGKIIVVANRLPVEVLQKDEELIFKVSPGGLVSALSAITDKYSLEWVGWPGDLSLDSIDPEKFKTQLKKEYSSTPVFLSRQQLNRYYFGFSNKVLWPILHCLPSYCDFDEKDWRAYKQVNEQFAQAAIEQIENIDEDFIWIHDYQLMLVPSLIRESCPKAKVGFFLHIPFPSPEIFKAAPYRDELLKGLLGANLLGFHTYEYLRQFRSCLLHILGIDAETDRVDLETHSAKLGVYPIGVDVSKIQETANSQEAQKAVKHVQQITQGRKLLLGVDRMDYTKGITKKLQGFAKFLARNPKYASQFVLVQIAVPTRIKINSYRNLKDEVEELVSKINDTYEDAKLPPVHLINKSLGFDQLSAYYKNAEVMLVTPIRDGMNLVAKEYVAIQKDKGVLILSEFTGAAGELGEALMINPFNTDQIADAIEQAVNMFPWEKPSKMSAMYQKVCLNDIDYWATSFIGDLESFCQQDFSNNGSTIPLLDEQKQEVYSAFSAANSRLILLDYDGTLAEITNLIYKPKPDKAIANLVEKLSALPNTEVAIVTGRSRSNCEDWFKDMNIIISAEHGLWTKWIDEENWFRSLNEDVPTPSWFPSIKEALNQFSRRTPGSFIEEKEASLAWHYRLADKEFGKLQARELLTSLTQLLANKPAEIISGKALIEIRVPGVNKGNVLSRAKQLNKNYDFIIAIGDDLTDEDMFAALPENAFSIKVGRGSISKAKYHLNKVNDVRSFLNKFSS